MSFDLNFYRGKKVFVTGHTGFKGSWLCKMLANVGAEVTGCEKRNKENWQVLKEGGI